jgi:hypothetical protein
MSAIQRIRLWFTPEKPNATFGEYFMSRDHIKNMIAFAVILALTIIGVHFSGVFN